MAQRPHPTRRLTLHHLVGIDQLAGVHTALAPDVFDRSDHGPVTGETIEVGGRPAVFFWAKGDENQPVWTADVEATLGRSLPSLRQRRCGVLLVVDVDGDLFAVTYGDAWHWIREEYREPNFGLGVVTRCLDQAAVSSIVSRRPGMGRTDSTHVAAGAAIWTLRPRDFQDVVRKLAGKCVDLPVTGTASRPQRGGGTPRGVKLEGAAGLRLPLGVRGSDLVEDLRAVRAVLTRPIRPEFAFVDTMRMATPSQAARLEAWFDETLGSPEAAEHLTLAVPDTLLSRLGDVDEYCYLRTPSAKKRPAAVESFGLSTIISTVSALSRGNRTAALRRHRVVALDRDGTVLADVPAVRWLETVRALDDEMFYLVDGRWIQIDSRYAARVRDEVRRAFVPLLDLTLPPWPRNPDQMSAAPEGRYNELADGFGELVTLDKQLIRDRLHDTNGLEVCDLLAPEATYIHVKRAKGAGVLSHLFAQGLNAVEAMRNQEDTRGRFREVAALCLAGRDASRYLGEDLTPRRVVFAMLKESGQLTADSLYPMSAATLAHTMRSLESWGISVHVVPIALEQVATASAA